MQSETITFSNNGFELTSDPARQQADQIYALLQSTHWGGEMSFGVLLKALNYSLCISIFRQGETVAFGRFVTDYATYAYLTDVVVKEELRSHGLGRWLVECALTHPDCQGLRRISLLTKNAGRFYESLGFTSDAGPLTYMEKR
jgi:ribosomal protein S18 acetylase RimI-like enzyme